MSLSRKGIADKIISHEYIKDVENEILQNLQEIKNNSSDTSSAISNATKEANNDAKLFATFDFMQAMNQLLYGNLDDNERSKLLAKMEKIAQSV